MHDDLGLHARLMGGLVREGVTCLETTLIIFE